ncbi:MAG: chaperone NapD [bacterium]|nr:chaperone NapD [bacterium]
MISGVVVSSHPDHLSSVARAVRELEWADVHFSDPAGRLVVTVAADNLDDSIARFGVLQQLPNVLAASLAEYWSEENDT